MKLRIDYTGGVRQARSDMLNTVRAVVRQGRIELLEQVSVPDGTELLVTILSSDESQFWLGCSESVLDRVWNNPEDDAYAELLKK